MIRLLQIAVLLMGIILPVQMVAGELPTDDDDASYHFKTGVELFKNGEFAEAENSFRVAYELRPSWKIKYNIAQCEAALKRYGLAIEAFEAYLAEGGDDIKRKRRDEVLEELRRLRLMAGRIKIKSLEGAVIYIDGILRGVAPINSTILVTAGVEHVITIQKEGIVLATFTETISGGETLSLEAYGEPSDDEEEEIEETPVMTNQDPGGGVNGAGIATGTGETDPPTSSSEDQKDSIFTRKPLKPIYFWASAGCAVGFGGAGLALSLIIDSKWKEAEKQASNDPWRYDEADANTIKIMQIATYASLGVAALGIIAAGLTFPLTTWKKTDKEDDEQADSEISLGLWHTSSSSGLVLNGRF